MFILTKTSFCRMTAASGASVESQVPRDDSLSHYAVVSSCDILVTALSGRGPFIQRESQGAPSWERVLFLSMGCLWGEEADTWA